MKKKIGWDVTYTWDQAERDAKECVRDAMAETGLPESAFEIKYDDSVEHPKVVGWVVYQVSGTTTE